MAEEIFYTTGDTPFFHSLTIQWRVIRALLLREIITRYGRHNIGFFWLFCEPLMFCLGVIAIRVGLHENAGHFVPTAVFALTGYSTVLLWRNCGNRCSQAITPNLSLLYHRNVRAIDVLVARIILEISGCAISFSGILIVFSLADLIKPPDNVGLVLAGYGMTAWFAASLAIFVCAATELSEVFERFWHPLTYFMLPISGLGFMVDWLPIKYQGLALLVPMVNGCEMLRDGYYGNSTRCHYSVTYLTGWCLALMLIGLVMLRVFARKAEPQ